VVSTCIVLSRRTKGGGFVLKQKKAPRRRGNCRGEIIAPKGAGTGTCKESRKLDRIEGGGRAYLLVQGELKFEVEVRT